MQDHLSRWQHELLYQRRLSPHTANAYRRDVSLLFELCEVDTPAEVTATHIRHSLALLHQQGEQPRSLARRLSAWRQFFDWALSDHSQPNPCQGVRAPKAPQPLPRALSVEQTQRLLDSLAPTQAPGAEPSLKEIIAYRDQALFELFYSCGLRLGELVNLDYRYVQTSDYQSGSWLELGEQQIHVQGKGQRQRLVPLGRKAQQALEHWLAVRPLLLPKHLRQPNQHDPAQHEPTQTAALFLGQRGKRIHPRVVQQQLAHRAQQAGLPEHVHPHRLRHSFASHILQSSQDLRAVQELLGHQNIRSTQIYTRLDFQHLAQIYDRAHPRAKKAHAENSQLEKEYTEKGHTKEDRTEVGRSETDVAKAGHVEGGRLESNDAEAGHIEVGRSEANSTEAGRTEVGHTEQNKK